MDLFRLEKFVDAVEGQLAALAAGFVATPRGFDVAGLHGVDPNDASAEIFHNAEALEDVTRPDGGGEAVGRVVGDLQRVGFVLERDAGDDGAEDFLAGDARGVVGRKNRRLDVIALLQVLRSTTTARTFASRLPISI